VGKWEGVNSQSLTVNERKLRGLPRCQYYNSKSENEGNFFIYYFQFFIYYWSGWKKLFIVLGSSKQPASLNADFADCTDFEMADLHRLKQQSQPINFRTFLKCKDRQNGL
jgi:hypothetical protein